MNTQNKSIQYGIIALVVVAVIVAVVVLLNNKPAPVSQGKVIGTNAATEATLD